MHFVQRMHLIALALSYIKLIRTYIKLIRTYDGKAELVIVFLKRIGRRELVIIFGL